MEGEGVFWLNFELKKKKKTLDISHVNIFFNHTSSLTSNIVDEEVTGGG